MAALEMSHYILYCRSWTLLLAGLALCRDAEQLLCLWEEERFVFSRQGRPRMIRKFEKGRSPVLGAIEKRNTGYPTPWGNEMRKWGETFPCKIANLSTFPGDSWILSFSSGFPASAIQKSPTLHPSVGPIPDGGRLVGSSPSWFVVFGSSDLAGAGTGRDERLEGVDCGSSSSGSTTNLQHQEKSGCSFLPLKYPPKKQFLWICPCTASADPS